MEYFPSLKSLIAFNTAAKHNSFKKAAVELHLTAAAIAYQIKKIEEYLQIELFTRHYKGVELNQAGMQYHDITSKSLLDLKQKTVLFKSQYRPHSLNILTFHAIAEKWLMPRLTEYRQLYPINNIHINACDNIDDAKSEDVVIAYSLTKPKDKATRLLMSEEVFPVCAPSYKDRQTVDFTAQQLSYFDLLVDNDWAGDWTHWQKKNRLKVSIQQNRSLNFSLYSMVIDAAVNGLGIMMGHQQLIKKQLACGFLVPAFENTQSIDGYYYLKQSHLLKHNTSAQNFCSWLKDQTKIS